MAKLTPKDRELIIGFWESEYQPLIKRILQDEGESIAGKCLSVDKEHLGFLQGQAFALKNLYDYLKKIYADEIKKTTTKV